MAIIDSTTGKRVREYSIEQLQEAANLMRGYDLVALCAAGSGHAGGTLSIMDICRGALPARRQPRSQEPRMARA